MPGLTTGPRGIVHRGLARYRNRPDTEVEQALIRFAIGLLALAYFAIAGALHDNAAVSTGAVRYAIGFTGFSALLLVWIGLDPRPSPIRRFVGMVMDMGSISYLMAIHGEIVTPLYPIYLWVAIGNGLRYGNRYLIASAAMAFVGMACVMAINPFWRSHEIVAGSLLLGLVIIPPYVAVLGHRLVKALQQANEANEAKRRFLANVSHEIYNPLHAIVGFIDLIRESQLSDEVRHYMNTLQASTTGMLAILKDILDISKIEAGKIELVEAEFDLYQTVNSVAAMLAPQAAKKGLLFTVHVDPACPYALRGDPDRLRQVLINLCNNAIKFTEHGNINLYVRGKPRSESDRIGIVFKVSDTGIGIPESMQAHVFESFTQADSSITRRFGGTGLGLAIAKTLVELQGGALSVDSRVGEGTTFRFEIPYEVVTTPAAAGEMAGRVCAITFDTRIEAPLQQWMPDWGLSLTVLKKRPSGSEGSYPFETIIVDERCLTNSLAFPQRMAALTATDSIHRSAILVRSRSVPSTEALMEAGWSVILDRPLDKRLLFNALHATTAEWSPDGTVVPLAPARETGPSAYRVLVVDDSTMSQNLTSAALTRAGHHVDVADRGEDALFCLESNDYDLVLMDLNLPDMSGLEVIQQWMIMSPAPQTTQIIMLTADTSQSVADECLASGAVRVLHKPVRPRVIVDAITEVMNRVEARLLEETQAKEPATATVLNTTELDELASSIGAETLMTQGAVFFDDAENKLAALREAADRYDHVRIADIAHAFKGNAGMMGAMALYERISELNQMAYREPGKREYDRILLDLRMLIGQTRREYRDYCDRRNTAREDRLK
jgi:two-component system sensor histidine kinase RpfC